MIFNPIVNASPPAPPQKLKITITGTGNATRTYVTINGTKYTSAATVEVDSGTVITGAVLGTLRLNGTTVMENSTYGEGAWDYTVTKDCTIAISGSGYNYIIDITE